MNHATKSVGKYSILGVAVILAIVGLIAVNQPFEAGQFAKSYFAAGDFAMGVFASGTFSIGIFSAGIFSFGLFSIGIFSAGLFSFGLFGAGLFAMGLYLTGRYRQILSDRGSQQPHWTSKTDHQKLIIKTDAWALPCPRYQAIKPR